MAGPLRWGFRKYVVSEHSSPFGRRFEVHTTNKELVAYCPLKRGDDRFVFYADENATEELFRLQPKRVRQFARGYEVEDARTGNRFGEIRKKEYKPLKKHEWFLFNPDGEPLGMVTEATPAPSLLRRLLPVEPFSAKAWQVHWGQQICGSIRPEPTWLGVRMVLDLNLDVKDQIDRRLALALVVAMNADEYLSGRAERP